MNLQKLNQALTAPLSYTGKRVCACTSLVLMFATMTFAYQQTDQKFMAAGIFAGVLYLLTTFAFVFEDGVSTGEDNKNNKE
jgi:hypothetical protein